MSRARHKILPVGHPADARHAHATAAPRGLAASATRAPAGPGAARPVFPATRPARAASRRGFTLVELTAALLLAGLIATAVTVSLRGARRATALEDVALRWKAYDEATRAQARRLGSPLRLRIAADGGQVLRLAADGDDRPHGAALDLPSGAEGVRVERVVTPADDSAGGDVDLRFSARGYSPSYSVLLAAPGGRRQWLVFAGLTGQAEAVTNERDAIEAVRPAAAAAGRDDAG